MPKPKYLVSTWPVFSQVRGVCSPQPFHEPKGPDRNERESEKCSAGQESRHRTGIHGILQEVKRLQFCSRLTSARPVCHVASANQIKRSFSKICSDQIVRSPTSTDVNLRGRRAYHITVAIERVQETGLVGAGIWLNSPQCALFYEECRFQRAIVPPEPHGSPCLVIRAAMIWKLNHGLPPIGLSGVKPRVSPGLHTTRVEVWINGLETRTSKRCAVGQCR